MLLILESAKQRIMKTNDDVWKAVPIQNVTKIPENIDGTCIYELPYDPVDRHTSSKDRRPWKKSIRSDKSIYKNSIVYFSKSINIHQIYCFDFTRTLHINNKIKKSFFFCLIGLETKTAMFRTVNDLSLKYIKDIFTPKDMLR